MIKKKILLVLYLFLCCFGFGGGMLTIFASNSVSSLAFLLFRKIPTAIFAYFLFLNIYTFFQKKN